MVFGKGPKSVTDLDMAISLSRTAESKSVQDKLNLAMVRNEREQAREIITQEIDKDRKGVSKNPIPSKDIFTNLLEYIVLTVHWAHTIKLF